MKEAIQKFLSYLRSVRNASPMTIYGYETDLGQFLEYLSPPDSQPPAPAEIDHRMIREFLGRVPNLVFTDDLTVDRRFDGAI